MLNKLKYEVFGVKRDDKVPSEPGNEMVQTYREKIDETGKKVLVEDEYYNIQEEIQSYEESVNINNIMERFVNGETDVLDRAKAFYADVSKVPKNMAQILDLNHRAQMEFKKLPDEVQELFGYSYLDFLNNPQKIDEYIESKKPVVNEVVEDVQAEKSTD